MRQEDAISSCKPLLVDVTCDVLASFHPIIEALSRDQLVLEVMLEPLGDLPQLIALGSPVGEEVHPALS